MDCRTVFTTVDHRYLQVACGTEYQGEISSYNWWLTKFIANLLGWSIDVSFGDKVRRLNKKSYAYFLNEHGMPEAAVKTIKQYSNFNNQPYVPSRNKGTMRSHLSDEKVSSLTFKMVHSLVSHDLDRAARLVGKGASVNDEFWVRDYDGKVLFNQNLTEDLPHQRIPRFTASHLTPLLYASLHQQAGFANLLRAFGADTRRIGHSYTFSRDIVDLYNHSDLRTTVDPVLVERGWGRRRHLEVRNHLGVHVETSQTVRFQDTLQKTHDLFLNQMNNLVCSPNPEPPHIQFLDSTALMGRTRLW